MVHSRFCSGPQLPVALLAQQQREAISIIIKDIGDQLPAKRGSRFLHKSLWD